MVVTSGYKWKSENQRVIESLGVPQPLLSSTSKELPEYVPRRTVDASQTSSASGYTDTEALTHADITVGPPHSDPEVNNSILCSLTRLSKCLVPNPSRKEYGPHIFVHVKFTIGFFFFRSVRTRVSLALGYRHLHGPCHFFHESVPIFFDV